jgi:hypothetical protein
MKKNKLLSLKRAVFGAIADNCQSDDAEILSAKIAVIIDDHFDDNTKKQKSKPYLASTGEEKSSSGSVVRTKGQSEKADAVRTSTV